MQGRSPRTPQMNKNNQRQERKPKVMQNSSEISASPRPKPCKPYYSDINPKSETIYAQPTHPGLGKRSLTQVEISRPKVVDPICLVQCFPKTTNYSNCQITQISSDGEKAVKKGLMWVQQDKMFSRWKERFIILTADYLQFFKKGSSKISEMGIFLFKVK